MNGEIKIFELPAADLVVGSLFYDAARCCRKGNEGYKKGALQSADTSNLSATPGHESASTPNQNIPQKMDTVNRQYSVSSNTATNDRQTIVQNLKGILNRGGDMNELRRYVDSLERDSSGEGHGSSEAQQILNAATDSGQSVEEYLRWNWEQYETEDGWNDAARQALDIERRQGRRQYSISEDGVAQDKSSAEKLQ